MTGVVPGRGQGLTSPSVSKVPPGLRTTVVIRGASLIAQVVKNLPAMQETSVQFLGWEDALKKETATTPVFLFTEFHGQRSLEGFSPRGHQELDMTE